MESSKVTASTGDTLRTTERPDGEVSRRRSFRDGQVAAIEGDAEHPRRYEYTVVVVTQQGRTSHALASKESRLGEGGADAEWTMSYKDMAGRVFPTEMPGMQGQGVGQGSYPDSSQQGAGGRGQ